MWLKLSTVLPAFIKISIVYLVLEPVIEVVYEKDLFILNIIFFKQSSALLTNKIFWRAPTNIWNPVL